MKARFWVVVVASLTGLLATPTLLSAAITERVSVSSTGDQGNSGSSFPAISADGRSVAFESFASNLVPGDTNGQWDVFVHDWITGATERVSVSSAGEQGNNESHWPAISADGRFVAFTSWATNLLPGDTNGYADVFVHDRATGATERVSVSSAGEEGNDDIWEPAISADGRFVAFYSYASNLVPGDTNGYGDIFVHDRATGATERVSVSTAGEEGNWGACQAAISADGSFAGFTSASSNLVPGDTNDTADIFVRGPGDVVLAVGQAAASPGETATVPVSLTKTGGVAGIQFDLEYSPPAGALPVRLSAVRAVGPTMGWAVDAVELVPGSQGRVIAYSPTSEELPAGSGPVLELDFLVDPEATIGDVYRLHPREVVLTNGAGESLKRADGSDGQVAVVGTVVPPDYLSFGLISSPQGGDPKCPLPFLVRMEARYASGARATSYQGTVELAVSTYRVMVQPSSVTFSRGVWEGELRLFGDQGSPACTLIATDRTDSSLTGESASFALRVKGDPTDDGEVNVLDVLRTVSITLGRELPQPPRLEFQGWAADMNCSGGVNVQDVVLVVQKSLGLAGAAASPSQQGVSAGPALLRASEQARTLSLEPASVAVWPGESFTLTVKLDQAAGVAGFQFDLSYDGSLVELVSPLRPGSLLAGGGWSLQSNQLSPNWLRVLGYSVSASELAEGSGSLVELDFRALAPGGNPLTLEGVVLSSGLGTSIPAVGVGGSVTVILFSDVPPDQWAYDEIAACLEAGIVSGYLDGTYHPEYPVTRDQMAAYVSRALAGGEGNVPPDSAYPLPSFSDVLADQWAYNYIEYAVSQNVVKGYDDGTYKPDLVVDRGQMAVFMAHALVAPEGDGAVPPAISQTFPDVPGADNKWAWCHKHVEYIADPARAVVHGYEDGKYHPEYVCTRDQMAVYVAKAFDLPL